MTRLLPKQLTFGTAGVSLRAVLQGIEPRLQAARGRTSQRAVADHVRDQVASQDDYACMSDSD